MCVCVCLCVPFGPQAFQAFVSTFYEQRRPVIPVLSAIKRSPRASREQIALRLAWSTLEQKVRGERILASIFRFLWPAAALCIWVYRCVYVCVCVCALCSRVNINTSMFHGCHCPTFPPVLHRPQAGRRRGLVLCVWAW